jgi:hypothetical protein
VRFRIARFLLGTSVLLGCLALFAIAPDIAGAGTVYGTLDGAPYCSVGLQGGPSPVLSPTSAGVPSAATQFSAQCTGFPAHDWQADLYVTWAGYIYVVALSGNASTCGYSDIPSSFTISVITGPGGCTANAAGGGGGDFYDYINTGSPPTVTTHDSCNVETYPDGVCVMSDSGYYYSQDTDANVVLYAAFGSVPDATPCTLYSISGNDNSPTSDGSTSYDYTIASYGATLVVANDVSDTSTGGTLTMTAAENDTTGTWTQPIYGKDFANDATVDEELPTLGDPFTLSVTFVSGSAVDPDFWCYDGTSWTDWGTVATLPGGSSPGGPPVVGGNPNPSCTVNCGAFSLAECLDSATNQMSLDDPYSWVSGGVSMGTCALQYLFVPTTGSVSSLADTFGITSNAPTGTDSASQWLGAMSKSVTAFPFATVAAIQSTTDAGGCSLSFLSGATDTLGGHTIGVCTILEAAGSGLGSAGESDVSWLLVILTVIVYAFGALLLFHFVRQMVKE